MSNRLFRTGVAASVACVCALAAGGSAQASTAPFTKAQAKKQLRDVTQPSAGISRIDPTTDLRDLALALPKLDGAAKRRAQSILSRPPDQNEPPYGGAWPRPSHYTEGTAETPSFVVHYPVYDDCAVNDSGCDEPSLTDTNPANGVPDYVDATVDAVDTSIGVENVDLAWPQPKGDGAEGEPPMSVDADRFDIYLADLCGGAGSPCVFGYANPVDNSDECNDAPFKCAAYLVLDNDYSEFGLSGGLLGLRVTTAHEYNHVLQFNIDSNEDTWMFESTATWAEDKVFPADDDWVRSYMGTWTQTSGGSVTSSEPGGGLRIYGSAIWNHWIEHGYGNYGADAVLNAWQSSRDVIPRDYAIGAYDNAIKDEGGEGFPQEFLDFTAATSEWNTGLGNLPNHEDAPANALPRVMREGRIKLGKKATVETLDNTSYSLFHVDPKNAGEISLKASTKGSLEWGIALVGRVGGRFTGTATVEPGFAGTAERRTVTLVDAQSYDRITAVVTNADGRVEGNKPIFGNFEYSKDGKKFKLRVR